MAMIPTMIAATHGEATKSATSSPTITASTVKLCLRVSVIWTSSSGSFTTRLYPVSWPASGRVTGQAFDDSTGPLACGPIGIENVGNRADVPKPRFENLLVHLCDRQPRDP